ncbi:MAG: hypothetical protein HeimC3_13390 [Candidatus Heimdallarchaeota archaeon LC_3]|nr:MAG: hypothetical protein HeimC3_13390 [Candidatus Heimdallarchaeota archaeon LC_3]
MNYDLNLAIFFPEIIFPFFLPIVFEIKFRGLINEIENFDFALDIKAKLRAEGVPIQENATFYVNSTSREMVIDNSKTEGVIIQDFLVLIYNDETGVVNFNPFWIFPLNLALNLTYPIYSFNFTITNDFTTNFEGNIGIKSTWVTKLRENFYNSIQNTSASHDFSALYDQHTGLLLQGFLKSDYVFNNGEIKNYSMNFSLNATNAFERFPPDPFHNSSETNFLPPIITNLKPNVILLVISFSLPIIIAVIKFSRIRKIDGGT